MNLNQKVLILSDATDGTNCKNMLGTVVEYVASDLYIVMVRRLKKQVFIRRSNMKVPSDIEILLYGDA